MTEIDEEDCHELRGKQGEYTQVALAEEYGVSQQTINYHQNGYCSHPEKSAKKTVERKDCFDIQEANYEGDKIVDIADRHGISAPTVLYHLDGKCSHPRLEFEGDSVTPSQCVDYRERAGMESFEDIAETAPFNSATVRYHVRGECSHEVDTSPRKTHSTENVDEEECSIIRSLHDEGMSRVEIAESSGRSRSTVRHHLHGNCDHPEEGAADPGETTELIDRETCGKMRAEYVASPNMKQVAEDFGFTTTPTRNHLVGACGHPGSGVDITQNQIHPLMWDAVYWLYFENHVSPAHIARAFGVTKQGVETIIQKMTETTAEDIPEEIPSD